MMPLNIYTHMATPEEIRKKNLEASNEALSESINLASQLNDKMSFLYKMAKEKFTQDKLSLDLTKQTVALTKNLSAEYDSVKQVERDIAKNKKLQNDIARQQLSLEKEIGEEGKRRIQYVQGREKSLTRSNEILKQLREKEAAGVAGAKEQANRLAQQILARKEALNTQIQNLTFEEKQYMMLQNASGLDPKRITSSGRGEFFPIDPAKTEEARKKNRRTEILLTPKLDELLKLLESDGSTEPSEL